MRTVLAIALLLGGAAARAGGALDEISAGSSQSTPTNPRTSWIADKLGGIVDANDQWQFRGDLTATRDSGSKPTAKSTFGDSGGTVLLANLSGEYDPNDNWSFRLVGGFSPASTTATATTVQLQDAAGKTFDADARLRSTASSVSGAAWLGYTTSSIDYATDVTFTATTNRFDTTQQITALQDRNGAVLDLAQLRTYCSTHACSPQLKAALAGQSATLDQLVLDGNIAQTLEKDTDLGLDLAYYLYDKDPTKVGYFTLAAAGRSSTFGDGISIAPLQYTIAPNVVHRWGQLMAMLNLSFGEYVPGQGYDLTASTRLQYKWKLDDGKRFKLYGKLTASRDVDQNNRVVKSGAVMTGAAYTW